MAAVVFDAMGTLFNLAPLRERLGDAEADAWFERTLHWATSLTLVGEFVPFKKLARLSLAATLARLGTEADEDDVMNAFGELPAFPDAAEAVRTAETALVLTNGGRSDTERLLERAGIAVAVVSVEEVRAYKPHPAPYRAAAERAGDFVLVAAHAWDVQGALSAGYGAVWVNPLRQEWPFPGEAPRQSDSLVEAVAATRP